MAATFDIIQTSIDFPSMVVAHDLNEAEANERLAVLDRELTRGEFFGHSVKIIPAIYEDGYEMDDDEYEASMTLPAQTR
jgi:hypothetical protein